MTLEILTEMVALPAEALERMLSILSERSLGKAIIKAVNAENKYRRRAVYFHNLKQINNLIYRLKRDGLIINKGAGVVPLLTQEGKYFLKELKGDIYKGYLPVFSKYKKEIGKDLIIIIFDIPERLVSKRNWLRSVLKILGYSLLQKSVWIGKTKIPQELIVDLKKLEIIQCIHIFTVKKAGTLLPWHTN